MDKTGSHEQNRSLSQMSLYIRLQSSFWLNRKTLRLRAIIGDAAYWVPPRLWSYAADNQADGDFSDYSDAELAMLVGYTGDAQALLQALHHTGFLKDRKVNDWKEHNNYHTVFFHRARKAANARWKGQYKKGIERKGKEKSKHCSSNAQAMPEALSGLSGFAVEWEAFRDHRKKLRVPMTDHAGELILVVLAERPSESIEALGVAMKQGWRGFKWDWFDNFKNQNGTNNGSNRKSTAESGRGIGTANEGKSAQYKGVGQIR